MGFCSVFLVIVHLFGTLKLCCEFSQIMPETGEIAPVVGGLGLCRVRREHFGGESGGPEGVFVEVAVCGLQALAFWAEAALALVWGFPEGGEERFPFRRVIREIWMGMGVGRGGHGRTGVDLRGLPGAWKKVDRRSWIGDDGFQESDFWRVMHFLDSVRALDEAQELRCVGDIGNPLLSVCGRLVFPRRGRWQAW